MTRPTFARTSSHARIHSKSKASPLKTSANSHKRRSSASSKGSNNKRDSHVQADEDDLMAALPSFCTTCEKQIIHPAGSFLYCSEACRRKDSAPCHTLESTFDAVSISPTTTEDAEEAFLPDIVPQRSPTMIRDDSISSSYSIFDRPRSRHDSDAGKYLSQFLTSGSTSPSRRPRPGYYRNPTATSNMTIPSLSNTPGSFGSPYSSYGSVSRSAISRHPPWAQQSSTINASVSSPGAGLVNASVNSISSTGTAIPIDANDAIPADGYIYKKKPVPSTSVPQASSLKQLFAHEAMRRPSALTYNKSSSSLSRQIELDDE